MSEQVATGDGWELRLGDCLDAEMGLASIGKVDHVITDPPYAKSTTANIVVNPFAIKGKLQVDRDADLDKISTLDVVVDSCRLAGQIARRWAVIFSDAESHHIVRAAVEAGGHQYVRFGFWRKPDSMPQFTGDRPAVGGEVLTISHRPGKKRWNGGGKHAFWICNTCKGSSRPDHPTPKPLALMEQLILDFTDPGDLVCDPFAGSGTTGVAAIKHGRCFIGWEKDPGFFALAARRLRSQPAVVQGQERPISNLEARMKGPRGPKAHRPDPVNLAPNTTSKSPASTGVPDGYRIAYSFGLDRWRVILPDGGTHWLAPGADKHAARRWAHRWEAGQEHTLCSTPGRSTIRPTVLDDDELIRRLRKNREDAGA